LAVLLIHANEVVSIDRLIDDLWGERPPPTARNSLQNLVSQLRKVLGAQVVETKAPGYVVNVGTEHLDSSRFELLLTRASTENPEQRVRTLEDALSLWRGPPYGEVFYESFAQGEIERLEELRATALEELYAAKIDLAPASEVVPALQALVAAYPFRERMRQELMLALYRAGRGVDALRTFVEWRARLAEEWDTQPGRAIEQTARDIRELKPELDEAIVWSLLGRTRAETVRRYTADLLDRLELGHALTVFEAAERTASGQPDRLAELDAPTVDAINVSILRLWRSES
jgi:DNA-binding SARP family transcriptional activator